MTVQEKIRLMLLAIQMRNLGYSQKYIEATLEVYK